MSHTRARAACHSLVDIFSLSDKGQSSDEHFLRFSQSGTLIDSYISEHGDIEFILMEAKVHETFNNNICE